MPDANHSVHYKAIADFSNLIREARRARQALKELHDEQNRPSSGGGGGDETARTRRQTDATREATTAQSRLGDELTRVATVIGRHRQAARSVIADTREESQANDRVTTSLRERRRALLELVQVASRARAEAGGRGRRGVGGTDFEGGGHRREPVEFGSGRHRRQRDDGPSGPGQHRRDDDADYVGRRRKIDLPDIPRIGGGPGVFDAIGQGASAALGPLFSFISGLGRIPLMILAIFAVIGPLIVLLGGLAAVAMAVGNVLISLAGTLAALPGLFLAAGAGIGALFVAIQPLAGVFQAYSAQQKAAASSGADLAKSEHALADAQRAAKRAQKDLTDARRESLRSLEDLRTEVARSALDEEGSILALKRAEDDYRRVQADGNSTALDRAEAAHRVKLAQNSLADTLLKNKRNQEDLTRENAKGVEGSDRVVAAQEALAQAHRQVADAQKESAVGSSAAADAQAEYQKQLAALSPSARAFVLGILSMADAWKQLQLRVQEKLFAPIAGQLENMRAFLPTLSLLLEDAAGAMGKVAAKGIEMVTSGPWKKDFADLSKANITIIDDFGTAALNVAEAFKDIAVAATPFTTWMSSAIKGRTEDFKNWTAEGRKTGETQKNLDGIKTTLHQLGGIFTGVTATVMSLYQATKPFTDWFLDQIKLMTDGWAKWGKEQEKEGSPLKTFLENVKPLLKEAGGLIKDLIAGIADIASDPENIKNVTKMLKTIRDEILPPLFSLIDKMTKSEFLPFLLEQFGKLLAFTDKFNDNVDDLLEKLGIGDGKDNKPAAGKSVPRGRGEQREVGEPVVSRSEQHEVREPDAKPLDWGKIAKEAAKRTLALTVAIVWVVAESFYQTVILGLVRLISWAAEEFLKRWGGAMTAVYGFIWDQLVGMKDLFFMIWDLVWKYFTDKVTATWEFVTEQLEGMKNLFFMLWDMVWKYFTDKITAAWEFILFWFEQIKTGFSLAWDFVVNYLDLKMKGIFGEGLWGQIKNGFMSAWDVVWKYFTDKATAAWNLLPAAVRKFITGGEETATWHPAPSQGGNQGENAGGGSSYHTGGLIGPGPGGGGHTERAILAQVNEFMINKEQASKPGARQFLEAFNAGAFKVEDLYGGLSMAASLGVSGTSVRSASVPRSGNRVSNTSKTENRGTQVDTININNPVQEKSDRSLRRMLQIQSTLSDR